MSSHKKDKKKQSSGAQMAMGPQQMSQMHQMWPLFPWNPMMQMGSPGMSQGVPTTISPGCSTMKMKESKPWDTSSDSSDSDFAAAAPSKKKRKVKTAVDGEKRGPGRPKKEETLLKEANVKMVQDYPAVSGKDEIAYLASQECKSCRLWKGRVALQPCGHAKFCFSCMEKFKNDAVKLQRPGKCLSDNCCELVVSWFRLYNVSP